MSTATFHNQPVVILGYYNGDCAMVRFEDGRELGVKTFALRNISEASA